MEDSLLLYTCNQDLVKLKYQHHAYHDFILAAYQIITKHMHCRPRHEKIALVALLL